MQQSRHYSLFAPRNTTEPAMNRIQKKCMIVSAGIHLLLAAMLIFGPGFLAGHSDDNSPPVLTFIPVITTDSDASGGGDNTVKNPPALGTTPEPPVAPAPVVTPPTPVIPPAAEPIPQKIERAAPPVPRTIPRVNDTPKIDLAPVKPTPRKTHEINVDTKLVTGASADLKAKRDAREKAAAAAAAEKEKRIAALLSSASRGVRNGSATSTELKLGGLGGGGLPYANFRASVQKAYWDAWSVPNGVPNVTVTVSVTIARDGTVISSRITDSSGNGEVDASVQRALDRVKFAAPLPSSATEDQRTVPLIFNTQAKLEG
jgi:colicin import membrane protein